MRPTRFLFAAVALASSAAFAGTVDVKFIDPDHFSDLATNSADEPEVMGMLTRHLQNLGAQLPANEVLHVDVMDVDLAGEWRVTSRGRVRTVGNRHDPPKFLLRYTLEQQGQVLRSGEDRVTDLDYANRFTTRASNEPLYYEKRLLSEWFARGFGAQAQALAR
jgi:hypothetical protein